MSNLLKSACNGIALLSHYVFWDNLPEQDVQQSIELFSKTIQYLKLANLPYKSFTQLASEVISESVSEETVKSFIAEILQIRKLSNSSDTPAEVLEILKNCSSVLGGNGKAYALLNAKISVLSSSFVKQSFMLSLKSETYKDYIRNFVRSSGKSLANFNDVLNYLNTMGVEHYYPDTFIGKIDENGILHTTENKRIEGLPLKSTLVMNTKYDPISDSSYVFSARAENAKSNTYFYTREYKLHSRENKFSAVKQLGVDIKKIRSAWLRILKTRSEGYEEAIILELIYQTQARIGSSSNKTLDKRTGKYLRTYGITTVRAKHVVAKDGELSFEYPGKGAFKGDVIHYQKHTIFSEDEISKLIVSDITKRLGKLEPEQEVFTTSATSVRELFKALGAGDCVSVHKLRTLKGTMIMTEKIKNHPFKGKRVSSTAITKWLREEALDVGMRLGHMSGEKYTPATAIAHYIDPVVLTKLFKELDVPIPKAFAKLSGELIDD